MTDGIAEVKTAASARDELHRPHEKPAPSTPAISANDARALDLFYAMVADETKPQREAPRCVCFSGLTDAQTRLLKLVGCLEALDFPIVDAIAAVEAPGPDHDPELAAYLRRQQRELVSATAHINESWPAARSP